MTLAMYEEPRFVLPHPPIPLSVFLVIEEAICTAWEALRLRPPAGFVLATALEVEITAHLHQMLKDEIWNRAVVDGFDDEIIRTIVRPEVINYNNVRLSKRPDMVVELVNRPGGVRPSQDGVFIECKPVDDAHRLAACYCDEGICRFVSGDYAWAMTEAMMIGYVDVHREPVDELGPALDARKTKVLPIGVPRVCDHSLMKPPVALTRHQRYFSYLEYGQQAPNITLRHLWLWKN